MTEQGDFVDTRLHRNAAGGGAAVASLGVQAGGGVEQLVTDRHDASILQNSVVSKWLLATPSCAALQPLVSVSASPSRAAPIKANPS